MISNSILNTAVGLAAPQDLRISLRFMRQNPVGVAPHIFGSGTSAPARGGKRLARRHVQDISKLILELFENPAIHQSFQHRVNDPRLL